MRNKVVATSRQNYGGRWFNRDEEIETKTQQDAEDIVALNFGKWPGPADNGKRRYRRRDMVAEK